MKHINKENIMIAIAILAGIILAHITYPKDRAVINCGIAEISPDYSAEHRAACRQARSSYNQ